MADRSDEEPLADIPQEVHDAIASWLGMNRSDASEFRDLYLGARAQTREWVDYESRRVVLKVGQIVELLWRRTNSIGYVLLDGHARAQLALLSRITELAKDADAADMRGLTDAYMSLARPGEDDFSSLALPAMPSEFDSTIDMSMDEREAGSDDQTTEEG